MLESRKRNKKVTRRKILIIIIKYTSLEKIKRPSKHEKFKFKSFRGKNQKIKY